MCTAPQRQKLFFNKCLTASTFMWTFVHGPKTVSHVIDEHIAPQKKQA